MLSKRNASSRVSASDSEPVKEQIAKKKVCTSKRNATVISVRSMDVCRITGGTGETPELHFLDLPPDALTHMLSLLSVEDILRASATCRTLRSASQSNSLWLNLCRPWGEAVPYRSWLPSFNSGKALYRLLKEFSYIVGPWSADELAPRGGLLYVTWGHLSVGAHRLIPPHSSSDRLRCLPVFTCTAEADGSSRLSLGQAHSGTLVWDDASKEGFHLETTRVDSVQAGQGGKQVAVTVAAGSNLQQRAVQYLLRLGVAGDRGGAGGHAENEKGVGEVAQPSLSTSPGRVVVPMSGYCRLVVQEGCKGRELAGLWRGVYGPHGEELLNVCYTGDGSVVAVKVVGDPNVPCGEVSFKARLESESTEGLPDPDQLAAMMGGQQHDGELPLVTTAFVGEGRVAGHHFRHPQWVSGRLLVEQRGTFAFVWEDVNFIIRFKRLSLEEAVAQSRGSREEQE